jgi:hypothetical protein
MAYTFNPHLIELVDIDSVETIEHVNMVDIGVDDDNTFTLSNGIISHNSAAKSVQAGRGKNPYIASFPLRGKPLNVREKDTKRILENEEIKKILTIIGLKLGEKVESVPLPDGAWVEVEINGKKMVVNENDIIDVDGASVRVSDFL